MREAGKWGGWEDEEGKEEAPAVGHGLAPRADVCGVCALRRRPKKCQWCHWHWQCHWQWGKALQEILTKYLSI